MIQGSVQEEMRRTGILLTQDDLLKTWEMLDIDRSGELTIDEFVSGFTYLHEALCTKHVVNIDYHLKRIQMNMENRIDRLRDDIIDLCQQNFEIEKSLQAQ